MHVASVCRLLPTPDDPSQGVFVKNRLDGMRQHMDVHALQPIAYFPFIRPLPSWVGGNQDGTQHVPMFYLPGVMKHLDAHWMRRSCRDALTRLHADHRLDVIDAHFGYPEAAACVTLGRDMGIPVFVTMRGHEAEYLKMPKFAQQVTDAALAADGVICVSHYLAGLMQDVGVPAERLHVIHNAVDRNCFHPGDKAAARAALNIPIDQPIVVSVGHLIHRKRHKELVAAFATVQRQIPDAKLYIAGSTSYDVAYTAKVRQVMAEHNLEEHVVLLGNVAPQEVARLYQAADLFALMTAREGCCNAVLESLASGLANVTTPAGDNSFFVRDGVNGKIVAIDDVAACAEGMVDLLQTPIDSQVVSASLGDDSWEQIGARIQKLFEGSTAT